MVTVHVACLAPSDVFDYASIFEQVISERLDREVMFEGFKPHRSGIPDHTSFDAVLVTGSEFHVYDDHDWVRKTTFFVRNALRSDTPVLGVCFGHQLLAEALGGSVTALDEREMGFREIHRTDDDSDLLDGLEETFVSFTSHQDHIEELPDEAEALARNEKSIQAFRSTLFPAYGIQFHPEYDLEMATELLERKDLSAEREDEIQATLTDARSEDAVASRQVFNNFFTRIVGER